MEIGEDSDGITVLDVDAKPGTPLAEVVPITDECWSSKSPRTDPTALGLGGGA